MRIVSGRQADVLVERLARRDSGISSLEPRVRRIIEGVRRGGDRSLRRYAERWDGLAPQQSLRVSDEEMAAAWRTIPPVLRKSLRQAAQNIRRFLRVAKTQKLDADSGRNFGGANSATSGVCGMLCAGRTLSSGFKLADDRDSGSGRGGAEHSRGVTQTVGGNAGCSRDAGRARVLSRGRRAGRRGIGVWERQYSAGRQNCGAGERLCDGSEEAGLIRLWN